MRELKALAAGAGGIWLAGKALGLAEAGMTRLLMAMGMDWGHAAARAPFAVWAALAILCGVASFALCAWEGAKSSRSRAGTKKHGNRRPRAGERKAG